MSKVIVYRIVEKTVFDIDDDSSRGISGLLDKALQIVHSDTSGHLIWQPVGKPYLAVCESEYTSRKDTETK